MSERPTEEPKTSLITKGLYPWGLLILILVTAWLLIGSLWFPAWWFNTLFLGQLFQWQNWKLAIAYLADQERGFLVGTAVAALIAAALVRRLWPRLRDSLTKFHCAIVIGCLTTILCVCAVLNATQRQRFVTSGSIVENLAQAAANFRSVEMNAQEGLTGLSKIEPPILFRYLDADKVSQLSSEYTPILAEDKRQVSSGSTSRDSAGLTVGQQGVFSAKGDVSEENAQKLTSSYSKQAETPERKAIELINYCIAKGRLKVYRNLNDWYVLEAITVANHAAEQAEEESAGQGYDPSQFTPVKPIPLLSDDKVKQVEATEALSNGLQAQLEAESGLVLVEGDFELSRRNGIDLVHHFSPAPHPIDFVIELPPSIGSSLTGNSKLTVFGAVSKTLNSAGQITVKPIAIY